MPAHRTEASPADTATERLRARRGRRARRALAALGGVGTVLSVTVGGVAGGSAAAPPKKITIVLGWIAQPARGGFFAAQQQGYYRAAGLDVKLIAGADVSPEQLVASGRAQFGVDDADQILLAASNGIPIEAVATTFQSSPFILLYHGHTRISSFSRLQGKTAYIFPGSLWWQYIVDRYHLTSTKQVAFSGSLQAWLANPTSVNQEYIGVADYSLHKDHVAYGYLPVSASGWKAYSNVLFAPQSEIHSDPSLVRSVVQATVKGWNYYRTHVHSVDQYLEKQGAGVPVPAMDENARIEAHLIYGGAAAHHGVGYMTASSWSGTYRILKSLHALHGAVKLGTIFTDAFLPKP